MKDYPNHGMEMTTDIAGAIEAAVHERDAHYDSRWQIDPLCLAENQAARKELFEQEIQARGRATLAERYCVLRFITRELVTIEKGGVETP